VGTTGDTAEAANDELDDIEQEHVCRGYFAVVSVLFKCMVLIYYLYVVVIGQKFHVPQIP